MSEEQRTIEQVQDDIAYRKKLIRGYEITVVMLAIIAVALFVKMAMYNSTLLDLISYTATLFLGYVAWDRGSAEEITKLFSELELIKLIEEKENDEKIS